MKKKIFAIALLSVTLFACSNEDAATTTDVTPITKNTSGDAKIDLLYAAMLNSPEYIAFKKAEKDFIGKMKFTGTAADIETSAKMISWISSNLSSTDFGKVSDAEVELANVKTLYGASMQANLGLYDAISGQPNPGQIWAQLDAVAYEVFGCPGCLEAFIFNLGLNAEMYAAGMDAANAAYGSGDSEAGFDISFSTIECFDTMNAQDAQNYIICNSGCN